MNTEARQLVSIIASAVVGAAAATLLVSAPSPSGNGAHFLTLAAVVVTLWAVGLWLVVAALFARGVASTHPSPLTSLALSASGLSVLAAGIAYRWPLHITFTVFAVLMWLRAAHLYARGIGQINDSQFLSQVLLALGMSIATLNYCLASSLRSTWVWVLAGLAVLLVLTGGAFKVRAISTKWANKRAASQL